MMDVTTSIFIYAIYSLGLSKGLLMNPTSYCNIVYSIILLYYFHVPGEVEIHPSEIAYACNGGQVELTCTVPGFALEWNFSFFPENGTTARQFSRLLESTSQDRQNSSFSVNSTLFAFSRTSSPNSLPLMSRLLISSVAEGLNGTVINCIDRIMSNVSSTIIFITTEDQTPGKLVIVAIYCI